MSSIRLGMIGAGQIALFTSREFRRHKGCDVLAVADPNAERAGELAAMVRAEQTYTEVDELLARDDLDAVYVAVPNAFHEEVAVKALEAGKHVLLDKPFALSSQAAENIIAAAEAADRTLMLGMNQRFERNVQAARALIAADARLDHVGGPQDQGRRRGQAQGRGGRLRQDLLVRWRQCWRQWWVLFVFIESTKRVLSSSMVHVCCDSSVWHCRCRDVACASGADDGAS